MTLLEAALDYAALGRAVFPCCAGGKTPAARRGFHEATTNPATVRRWWLANGDYNVGLATGAASRFWVIDIDDDAGEETLRRAELENGALPPTLEVITARGRHLWFAYLAPIPCSAGRIGPGIDVRGDGGYVLAPPSIHPDGRAYAWSVDSADAVAVAPDWLVALTRRRPSLSERALETLRVPRLNGTSGAYGKAALEAEISALAGAPNGQRNHALNRAAFNLFQLVAGGELSEADVLARLIEAAIANGLMTDPNDGPSSVQRTIASGRRAGLQHPRSRGAS